MLDLRLVWLQRGYSKKKGIDFSNVLSLVVKHTSIRALLALVAINDMELEQLDVKTGFLHDELEETIYMNQLEGFLVQEAKTMFAN